MNIHTLLPWVGIGASLTTGMLGLLALSASPRSVARLSFAVGMLLLALECVLALVSAHVQTQSLAIVCQEWRLAVVALLPGVWLVFSLHYARSQVHPLSEVWKWLLPLSFVVPVTLLVLPRVLSGSNEFVLERTDTGFLLGRGGLYLHGCVLFTSIVVLGSLEQTFRAAAGTMRWRIKFLLLGLGMILLGNLYTSGWVVFNQSWPYSHELVRSASLVIAGGLILWALMRMGLSEAEVYPSRRVILGATTTSLVLAYLFLVFGFARIVSLRNDPGTLYVPALIILVGLLVLGVALMSDRVRQQAILFFSRHFNRPLYDYRAIWQTFMGRVAQVSEECEYCRVTSDFVSQTFDAMSVTIWQLDPRRKLSFGGSTVLTRRAATVLLSQHSLPNDLLDSLVEQRGVVDLDDSEASWRDARGWLFARQFQQSSGHRLCVPLLVGEELVGVLLIGDRVNERPYSAEELDLLHTLAGEISRGLLNLRNARQLLAARELQAFQSMSAFVVHDLKNSAATLSLTLQNFRKHHDNVEFRDDALRSVSSCVAHLNEIIRTLGVLRQDLEIHPAPSDLNALIRETCADLGVPQSFPVDYQFGSIPPVWLDPVQIRKVVANLVLNAKDAAGPKGHVRVATRLQHNGKVELAVHDDGCGMDSEFIRTRLFRPFQSTKKKGLGIGLFHSRMILDAHRAEIEVESQPGQGTVFQVSLPLNALQS